MKRKYKIKADDIGRYNVFYTFWWCPIWIKSNSWISPFRTIDSAKEYIEKHRNPVYL